MPPIKCKDNDPSISDSENLLRRIPPALIEDGRISINLFDDDYCSVEVASKSTPEECLAHYSPEGIKPKHTQKKSQRFLKLGWKVASIKAQVPREGGQTVYFEPLIIPIKNETFINDAHAVICGQKSKALLLKMTYSAQIVLAG